ncbi:MAG TPA: ABC transporter permease subunit [Actinocrinis sp.]|uniref:ABC transporter permease n=1 Tax=Actinocrinis sp. TaxID=1920516 RepID=UPI002D35B19F|nr:ABC transporter permease subunit [Actinocrinis sp.]HZU58285.1 ABC transporter permease subunit [Actinocrinis sp.]
MAGLVTDTLAADRPEPSDAAGPPPGRNLAGRLSRVRWWRVLVLAVVATYLLGPLLSALWFTVYNSRLHRFSLAPYGQLFGATGFLTSVRMTFFLALTTIALEFVLLVPAMVAIRLRLPRLRGVVESIAMVPLVVSPVALTAGVSTVLGWGLNDQGSWLFRLDADLQNQSFPLILPLVYAILVLPFAFRALDAGLRAVDLKTLVEAARGLGASWPVVLWRVLLPNLRAGLLSAAVLTLALVFGEYTIASILGFVPFAVWIVQDGQGSGQLPIAVSLLSLLLSWAVLFLVSFLGGRRAAAVTDRSA